MCKEDKKFSNFTEATVEYEVRDRDGNVVRTVKETIIPDSEDKK